ncbi:MAG: hypothetical protein GY782_03625 [Gammaproteobacteria bacterium]|nr:hypothetical protein [Gammaproteobacteria bacterium]
MANPFYVQPADYSQGLGVLGQAVQGFKQNQQQEEMIANDQALRSEAARLFKEGTPDEIAQFSIANPDYGSNLASQIAFKNDATRQNMMESMQQILANPEQTESILTNRIKHVQEQGGDPSQTIAELEKFKANPEGYEQGVERAYAIMDPQGYKSYASTIPQQPKQPEPITPYQQAQIEGKNQDRELRRQEIELRRLESEQKRAKTSQDQEVKSQQIEQKKKEIEESKAQDKQAINDKIILAENNSKQVKELLDNQEFIDDLTGLSGVAQNFGIRPTQDARDAQIILDNIVSNETLNNLGVMSGPLTDKDIEVIRSASTRLREGMSEKAMKSELKKMLSAYSRVIKNYRKESSRKGYEEEPEELSDQQLLDKY